ncbi:MAG: hypothetical protein KME46_28115 [Brasilonema angustatum HA4187-MV1]|jgi:hypothetical protein|nr:hypothetical protein [Brasilonema angustatum HA4187-MV1]MBW4596659.1 hypothetical protein [Brasilonema angustatum HA4187-MV1]MBW4596660.1 hypothetical protein [Brasilonema angustatum HA4187-MV1]
MQDELKKVISEAMDTNSELKQEPTEQIPQGELSDEALESVAGGVFVGLTLIFCGCKKSRSWNANNQV